MRNSDQYNQNKRSGRRRGSGRRDGSRRDSARSMHKATCDECGNDCEVPFKPSNDKPIYCSNCFDDKKSRSEGFKRSGGRSFERSDFQEKRMFGATCDECGKACEVPFKPTTGKPIYCSNCFSKSTGHKEKHGGREGRHGGGDNDQVFQQIRSLNSKLDKVLNLLESGAGPKESPVKEIKEIKKPASKSATKKTVVKKKPAKKASKKKK